VYLITHLVDDQGNVHEFVLTVPPEGISRYLTLTPKKLLQLLPKSSSDSGGN